MRVRFFATYRRICGCNECDVEPQPDVLALLHYLSQRWPAFRPLILSEDGQELGADAIVMVNGRHIQHLEGVHTALSSDDTIAITPLVAGG